MTTYLLWKTYPDLDVVDSNLRIRNVDARELIGIFESYDDAVKAQEAENRKIQEDETDETIIIEIDKRETSPDSTCFCVERWYDEDLEVALQSSGLTPTITDEMVACFRKEVEHIFDDKSDRNEMLTMAAYTFLTKKGV